MSIPMRLLGILKKLEQGTMTDTKQKIVDVACELFAAQGFDGVSIRAIAKAADVNLAAVNYHFKNKSFLYAQIITNAKKMFSEEVQSIDDGKISALDASMKIFDMFMERSTQFRHTFAMILSEAGQDCLEPAELEPGPPGHQTLVDLIRRDYGESFSKSSVDWAVCCIYSHIAHIALLSGTSLMEKMCSMEPEIYTQENQRKSLKHGVKAILEYMQNHDGELTNGF